MKAFTMKASKRPRLELASVLASVLLALALSLSLSLALSLAQSDAPDTIALPNGFQPEGVVAGPETTIYAGSLADGAIYQADVATGEGSVLVPGEAGRITVGLAFDPRTGYLYAAGGPTGMAHVFDTGAGELLRSYALMDSGTFINDAILSGDAVYFTDSNRAALYRLELLGGGALPEDEAAVSELAITGEFTVDENAFNANGIEVTDSGTLIIVKSNTGQLFTVDPKTGTSAEIDLGGANVMSGDGILLEGNTLYVLQNRINQIAVLELSEDRSSAIVRETLTNPNFDVPTTLAGFEDALYAVNARFGTEPTPETQYAIVRVPR